MAFNTFFPTFTMSEVSLSPIINILFRVRHQPKESINDSMRGVNFDYTFSGERVGKVGPVVNHLDQIRDNNSVNNLDWVTVQQNLTFKGCHLRGAEKRKKLFS